MKYFVELVWNREFNFVQYGPGFNAIKDAIKFAREMEYSGDGARVKKTRIISETGDVVWQYGARTHKETK